MFALQHSKLYDAFSQKKLQFPFYGKLAAPNSHQGTPIVLLLPFLPRKDRSQPTKTKIPPIQKTISRPIPAQSAGKA